MHPRGGFGLVFNFGDLLRLDGHAISEPLFLDGATTISRKMGFLGWVELMGVRFHEGGAYPVLGLPLAELRNAISLLDALDRPSLLRLHALLYEAPSLPARVELLDAWLLERLALGNERHALVPASLGMLRARAGRMPMPELARELAISQRQLERIYQTQVGMSPKQYAQLLRVETARLALKRMDAPSTTYLAAELGFYDQSHFIREFSAVVGMTPYAYLKRSRR
jgi:AraC-like DNA-binding protein